MKLFKEAGLPDGVINLVTGSGAAVGDPVLKNRNLAGIHFTGSTRVFHQMWRAVSDNIDKYNSYPRLVGETGGKDFIIAHASADTRALATAIVRGAFEYQGQKCSAASRVYVPSNLWPQLKDMLVAQVKNRMGDVATSRISGRHDRRIHLQDAGQPSTKRATPGDASSVGDCDDSEGGSASTIIEDPQPAYRTLCDELFGPVRPCTLRSIEMGRNHRNRRPTARS